MRFETNNYKVSGGATRSLRVSSLGNSGEDTMIPSATHTESTPALRRPSLQVALSPEDRRFQRLGENHHLWRNGRFWWIAYTVIIDGWRQERIRHSLKTDDLTEARVRRDEILASVSSEGVLRRVS
ncbi:hypothetical protein TBR22_A35150 [Luteitalea sp. TBR-22]|nr:hypothetical protein TBR22_A35150 [Luteitalea sp. TBR-22]